MKPTLGALFLRVSLLYRTVVPYPKSSVAPSPFGLFRVDLIDSMAASALRIFIIDSELLQAYSIAQRIPPYIAVGLLLI